MRADARIDAVFGLLVAFPGAADEAIESLPRALLEYLAEWSADDQLLVESPLLDGFTTNDETGTNAAPPLAVDDDD